MGFVELLFIALGLSMDAFVIAWCAGVRTTASDTKQAFLIAGCFGGFQFVMTFGGWAFATVFEPWVSPVGHWVAFILLCLIGGQMLWESWHQDEKTMVAVLKKSISVRRLLLMGIAGSIDALAVGITFAFLPQNIITSSLIIGIVSALLSLIGVLLGQHIAVRGGRYAYRVGGIILILIGLHVLFEYLGLLG